MRAVPYWLLVGFIAGAILATCQQANAQTNIYAGAWSKHLLTDDDYNETHNLAAVEHRQVMAGYFKNSYNRDTVFAGYRFKRAWGDLEGGLLVGAMHGYTHCAEGHKQGGDSKLCPMVVPSLTYTRYDVQPTVLILGNAVAFSVRFRLY